MALALVIPGTARAERPRVGVAVRFDALNRLRTRIASELRGTDQPDPERFLEGKAQEALSASLPRVYVFERGATGAAAATLLVTLTRGGAMEREWPMEQVDLKLCLATTAPALACKPELEPVRLGKVLDAGEELSKDLYDRDFVGAAIRRWGMGTPDEEIYGALSIPIHTSARATADGKIETPLSYEALGVRRRDAIFAVDTEESRIEFRACLSTVGGYVTTGRCAIRAPRPPNAPPAGRRFGEIYYVRQER